VSRPRFEPLTSDFETLRQTLYPTRAQPPTWQSIPSENMPFYTLTPTLNLPCFAVDRSLENQNSRVSNSSAHLGYLGDSKLDPGFRSPTDRKFIYLRKKVM
jgi:hypothetical protein